MTTSKSFNVSKYFSENSPIDNIVTGIQPVGIQTYNTVNDLPLSAISAGSQAYVNENNRLYMWTGAGWFSIALINTNPSFDSGGTPEASYQLDSSEGIATVIQLSANDPEDLPIQWSYVASDSAQYFADITNDSSVFTITAKDTATIQQYDSAGGTFSITFKASDGVNLATALSEFTITFSAIPDWTLATQQAKLVASDAQAIDFFGYSVSISDDGNTAIIGAHMEDTGFPGAGSAYIFARDGSVWTEQAKIQPNSPQTDGRLGISVSISGDGNTAIVGEYLRGTPAGMVGAAYIFVRSGSTWTEQAKLVASDAAASDRFGVSVSISGDGNTAIVGANLEDPNGALSAGSAYIFTRNGSVWTEQAKLVASDAAASDQFGISVSISGDGNTAIVGAARARANGIVNAGSAYIFTRTGTTWTEQAKLVASDAAAIDRFGISVSISGDGNTAIVGANLEDANGLNYAGAAYIFVKSGSTWGQQTKLVASDAAADDIFGISVSISDDGNIAIVGAEEEDTGFSGAGSAYIFARDGSVWTEQAKIQASDAEADDKFGTSVSISGDGNTAIVGADYEDPNGINMAGSAYIFTPG